MSKKLCNTGLSLNKSNLKLKYKCKKCDFRATKEKFCCKPVKLKKSA